INAVARRRIKVCAQRSGTGRKQNRHGIKSNRTVIGIARGTHAAPGSFGPVVVAQPVNAEATRVDRIEYAVVWLLALVAEVARQEKSHAGDSPISCAVSCVELVDCGGGVELDDAVEPPFG